jgi:uncharacterized membrane protein YdjX (TVP38/TMEM64 family)
MRSGPKWTILVVLVALVILVPFGIWGQGIDRWVAGYIDASRDRPLQAAVVLGGLLAGDIVLPTPSSLISTACGSICGFWSGLLASWMGMNVACLCGYLLGRFAAGSRIRRMMGEPAMAALERLSLHRGPWFLVLTRPVPVLAEAAVLFAGLGRLPPREFVGLTAVANLGISAVYAGIGATASTASGFVWAFLLAMLLSGLFMLLGHRMRIAPGPPETG